jgi:hypothetical protein
MAKISPDTLGLMTELLRGFPKPFMENGIPDDLPQGVSQLMIPQ